MSQKGQNNGDRAEKVSGKMGDEIKIMLQELAMQFGQLRKSNENLAQQVAAQQQQLQQIFKQQQLLASPEENFLPNDGSYSVVHTDVPVSGMAKRPPKSCDLTEVNEEDNLVGKLSSDGELDANVSSGDEQQVHGTSPNGTSGAGFGSSESDALRLGTQSTERGEGKPEQIDSTKQLQPELPKQAAPTKHADQLQPKATAKSMSEQPSGDKDVDHRAFQLDCCHPHRHRGSWQQRCGHRCRRGRTSGTDWGQRVVLTMLGTAVHLLSKCSFPSHDAQPKVQAPREPLPKNSQFTVNWPVAGAVTFFFLAMLLACTLPSLGRKFSAGIQGKT